MGTSQTIYGLTNDVVFKYVFGSPENERLTVCLINVLLGLEGPERILGVTYLNPFSTKAWPTERGSIVDVRVRDASERLYYIEVQVAEQLHFGKRAVYYAAKTYADQLKAREGFETLKKTTGISILNFELFNDDPRLHTIYRLLDLETGRELADTLELHFVELEKFDPRRRGRLSRFDRWIDLFRKAAAYAGGAEPLPPEFAEDEEVKMALKQVEKVNADAEMRAIIEAQEKWEHDVASRLYDARQKGLEEGRKEGREEGREDGRRDLAAVVTRLAEKRFGMLSQADRQRIADAPEQDLMKWAEELLSAGSIDEVFRH